jgi:5-methylthioadenosine/S-adenosylhomocysteine deaminase
MASAPIEDAEIIADGDRIMEVRVRRTDGVPTPDARDFGEAVILPGFVNVHAHVEYTAMRGLLHDLPFFRWIRTLTALKPALDPDDYSASAIVGVAEAIAGGITTIGDCTDTGAALEGLLAAGARGIVYKEVFGLDEQVSTDDTLSELECGLRTLKSRAEPELHMVGVSPHSVYTVHPALMRALASMADTHGLPMCIHAAESNAEVEFVRSGTGEIAQHFAGRNLEWAPRGGSVIRYLNEAGALGTRTLLVHGINISAADRQLMCESGASWAHCPRSNAQLGVGVAPLQWMEACSPRGESRVGLGTDSVVSANTMDMFEEMRFAMLIQRAMRRTAQWPTAQDMLTMATIGGARALNLAARVGALAPGMAADVAVLSLRGLRYRPVNDLWSAVVLTGTPGDVVFTCVAGRPLLDRGRLHVAGLPRAQRRLLRAARKLAGAAGTATLPGAP